MNLVKASVIGGVAAAAISELVLQLSNQSNIPNTLPGHLSTAMGFYALGAAFAAALYQRSQEKFIPSVHGVRLSLNPHAYVPAIPDINMGEMAKTVANIVIPATAAYLLSR
ncbi:MAG: hypothetical protein Q7S65_06125 [Nanoarchaeota archaeon]|nr:hypothetical protein [Nanoarchaeota archaeon]